MTDPDDVFENAEPSHAIGRYIYPGVPSTVLEVRQVLIDWEHSRPRSAQVALGPSEIGTPCAQQIGRKLAAQARPDAPHEPAWAPFQGTAVHVAMAEVVKFWNAQLGRVRWLTDTRVLVSPELKLSGESDAFDLDNHMVIDWKHVGVTALKELETARGKGKPTSEQISQEYRVQTHLYGLGHKLAGRRVDYVRVVFLPRDWKYDKAQEWTEPFDEKLALDALERYRQISEHIGAGGKVMDLRATPTSKCWWCPFRTGQASDEDGCRGKA